MNVKFWQAGISWTKFQIFNELGLLVVLLVLLLLQTAQGNSLFSQAGISWTKFQIFNELGAWAACRSTRAASASNSTRKLIV